ncbi:MAG: HDOD domain-containing protein [Verrucomicrobia bacterium]|nr:HDOD domain-containing protein [Verrucomicrobiota bacterium]
MSFIGIDLVKHLVLAVGIFSQFEKRKLGGLSLEALWQHSVRTANAADQDNDGVADCDDPCPNRRVSQFERSRVYCADRGIDDRSTGEP